MIYIYIYIYICLRVWWTLGLHLGPKRGLISYIQPILKQCSAIHTSLATNTLRNTALNLRNSSIRPEAIQKQDRQSIAQTSHMWPNCTPGPVAATRKQGLSQIRNYLGPFRVEHPPYSQCFDMVSLAFIVDSQACHFDTFYMPEEPKFRSKNKVTQTDQVSYSSDKAIYWVNKTHIDTP